MKSIKSNQIKSKSIYEFKTRKNLVYIKYFNYLFSENSFNELAKVLKYDHYIKNCSILTNDKPLTCPEPRYMLSIKRKLIYYYAIFNPYKPMNNSDIESTFDDKNIANYFQGIRLTFHPFEYMSLQLTFYETTPSANIIIEQNTKTKASLTSYTVKKLYN